MLALFILRNQQKHHEVDGGMVAGVKLDPFLRSAKDSNCFAQVIEVGMGQAHATAHTCANLLLAALKSVEGFLPHLPSQNTLVPQVAYQLCHGLDTGLCLKIEEDPLFTEQIRQFHTEWLTGTLPEGAPVRGGNNKPPGKGKLGMSSTLGVRNS